MFEEAVEGDILNVEVTTDGPTATVSVWGDSNAIPLWETVWTKKLANKYPNAEIRNTEVFPGQGLENCPESLLS